MSEPTGPLKGLRVFDLTRVLAGPTCAQMLGDLGADVIKIERPGAGDDTRAFAPPYMAGTKESAYFTGVNRNKLSVTLDIGQKEGQDIALKLIAECGVPWNPGICSAGSVIMLTTNSHCHWQSGLTSKIWPMYFSK